MRGNVVWQLLNHKTLTAPRVIMPKLQVEGNTCLFCTFCFFDENPSLMKFFLLLIENCHYLLMSFQTSYNKPDLFILQKTCFYPYNESQWGPKHHWSQLIFIVWMKRWNIFQNICCFFLCVLQSYIFETTQLLFFLVNYPFKCVSHLLHMQI